MQSICMQRHILQKKKIIIKSNNSDELVFSLNSKEETKGPQKMYDRERF